MRFFAALICIFCGTSAFAQNCAPRDHISNRLLQIYGETPLVEGITPTSVFELFASAETGTWTLVFTDANGISCFMASGSELDWAHPPVPKEEKPDL